MNKKTKKRLAAAGIALIGVMLASHVAFTVAWYNGSSQLAVNSFDIAIKDKNIHISLDNENFKDELDKDDIKDAIPDKYRPVSSAFSSKWLDQKADTPQFVGGYTRPFGQKMNSIDDVKIMDKGEGFFQQVLYIKSDAYAKITLDPKQTYINANRYGNELIADKVRNKMYPNLSHEEMVEQLNRIEDSLRFSILVLNDSDKEETGEDYQYAIIDPHKRENEVTKLGGILDADGDGFYDYVEDDNKEVIYGDVELENDDSLVYEGVGSNDGDFDTNSCFRAAHKNGVQLLDFEKSKAKGMNIKEEQSLSLEDVNQFTFTLQAGVSKKIVLSQYIEGWDLDSDNYTMFSRFVSSICFKVYDGKNGGN